MEYAVKLLPLPLWPTSAKISPLFIWKLILSISLLFFIETLRSFIFTSSVMGNIFTVSTGFITVAAQPEYMEHESSPVDGQHVWMYHIKITNNGKHAVQLMNRYWHITDGKGMVQEVRGPGVVGLQPVILPDEHFEYTSSVSLTTSTGIMHGTYEIKMVGGETYEVNIPVFSLDSAEAIRLAH